MRTRKADDDGDADPDVKEPGEIPKTRKPRKKPPIEPAPQPEPRHHPNGPAPPFRAQARRPRYHEPTPSKEAAEILERDTELGRRYRAARDYHRDDEAEDKRNWLQENYRPTARPPIDQLWDMIRTPPRTHAERQLQIEITREAVNKAEHQAHEGIEPDQDQASPTTRTSTKRRPKALTGAEREALTRARAESIQRDLDRGDPISPFTEDDREHLRRGLPLPKAPRFNEDGPREWDDRKNPPRPRWGQPAEKPPPATEPTRPTMPTASRRPEPAEQRPPRTEPTARPSRPDRIRTPDRQPTPAETRARPPAEPRPQPEPENRPTPTRPTPPPIADRHPPPAADHPGPHRPADPGPGRHTDTHRRTTAGPAARELGTLARSLDDLVKTLGAARPLSAPPPRLFGLRMDS